jgi:glycosyltransferase involved in cell wall biosynthesis
MIANSFTYEIVFVDDGSIDNSWNVVMDLQAKDENVKAIKFQRNYGKSAALHMAFQKVVGEVVITMDADKRQFLEGEAESQCLAAKTRSRSSRP